MEMARLPTTLMSEGAFIVRFGSLLAILALVVASTTSAFAAPTPPGADTGSTLGPVPLFSTGYTTDQFGAWYKTVVDSTASTPAASGALVVFGGSTWAQSAAANQTVPFGAYGVVSVASPAQGGAAVLQVRGKVNALCTTGSVAIAAGSLLVADGSGNLTVPAPPTAPTSGTATPQGTTGATTVTYSLYARGAYSLDSAALTGVTTATANATLSPANSILIAATVPAGTTDVVVVRTAGGAAQGVISRGLVAYGQTKFSFVDPGYTAGAATYTANTTPSYPAGSVLAVSLAALTASSTATSTSVYLQGY